MLSDDLGVSAQLRSAEHLVRIRDLDILLIQPIKAAQPRIFDIDLAKPPAPCSVLEAVLPVSAQKALTGAMTSTPSRSAR